MIADGATAAMRHPKTYALVRPLSLAVALAACSEDLNPAGDLDGAVVTEDSGTTPEDSGTTPVDVGTTPVDVGTTPVDVPTSRDVVATDSDSPRDVPTTPTDVGVTPSDVPARIDVQTPRDVPAATDVPAPRDVPAPMDVQTPRDVPAPMDVQVPRDVPTPMDVQAPRDVPPPVDAGTPTTGVSVTTFQFDRGRSGANRSETRLTPATVRAGFGRVTAFAPSLDGEVYAQPLYLSGVTIGGARRDVLFVATQSNSMYALDAATGAQIWRTALGTPAQRSMQSCGNIGGNIGVVSTGVIDPATGTLYAVAFTNEGGLRFRLNALDVATGRQRTNYPANITPVGSGGLTFDVRTTGERGALQFDNGRVFVPFGGLYGDCGTYHGWVVGINTANPTQQVSFNTPANGSGIWAVGGPSMDETGRLFVATGNGNSAAAMGERVIRLNGGAAGPTLPAGTTAYFEPSDARSLDSQDLDIGSISPLLLPAIAGAPRLIWQGGKAGVSYLLNRDNLGGSTAAIAQTRFFSGGNYGAAATWSNGTDTFAFIPGRGTRAGCSGSGGVMAVRITAGAMTTAWCSGTISNPNPPAVSSNGNSNGILWVAGAGSGATLRAIDVSTGMEIFADAPPSVRQWTPVVVADGRVYVTGSSTVSLYTTR